MPTPRRAGAILMMLLCKLTAEGSLGTSYNSPDSERAVSNARMARQLQRRALAALYDVELSESEGPDEESGPPRAASPQNDFGFRALREPVPPLLLPFTVRHKPGHVLTAALPAANANVYHTQIVVYPKEVILQGVHAPVKVYRKHAGPVHSLAIG